MSKEKKEKNLVDKVKLEFLKIKLTDKKITSPTRKDVMRILKISYPHAYNYILAIKKSEEEKK